MERTPEDEGAVREAAAKARARLAEPVSMRERLELFFDVPGTWFAVTLAGVCAVGLAVIIVATSIQG